MPETNGRSGWTSREPMLSRVAIRNYRSIGHCDLPLERLTIVVGRNGAGKSNFLDALRFVADALRTSLDHALRTRGGVEQVRRRSTGHPRNFAISLGVRLRSGDTAEYEFEIAAGYRVKRERLRVRSPSGETAGEYLVLDGEVQIEASSPRDLPPAAADRLYLVTASGRREFREVYDDLSSMGFYNLNPQVMKDPQRPDAGDLLARDGSNIASVIERLSHDRAVYERLNKYLDSIVPGIEGVSRKASSGWETLEFKQRVEGAKSPWRFEAASMSDGTLRALGALVAVSQFGAGHESVRLVGIEEPETALHAAAAECLLDALREAASHTQILITTHSPDLLDLVNPDEEQLLVAQSTCGETSIGPLDAASRELIRNHLYRPGELLRLDQLQIDRESLTQQQLPFAASTDPGTEE